MYPTYMPQYQYQQRQDFMPMQQPQQVPQQAGVNPVRPVASKAEVNTFQISFDGTPYFFYDTSCGDVYIKTFDSKTGTAPVATYKREVEVAAQPPEYATVDSVLDLRQTINRLAEEIDRLKKPTKAVKKDDAE